ncbi:MAG: hypothetical protein CME62_02790 [Halobacteriovoraceae bacterium]|nr:hypothetical protein [Halobacteriovoraceae bacterium]|tara:strand:+ start:10011 stop:10385 length:375 start_codon:yes stop_codon:yes gene_type:complete
MIETQNNLIEFLEKAYQLTINALKEAQNGEFDKLNNTLENRKRAINIIDSLSQQLALHQKNPDHNKELAEQFNNQVNQVINKINSVDEIMMACLEHEKSKTQFEIAKTFKNKENFKGYNLNNTK